MTSRKTLLVKMRMQYWLQEILAMNIRVSEIETFVIYLRMIYGL